MKNWPEWSPASQKQDFVPIGRMLLTCERFPAVLWMNTDMEKMLAVEKDNAERLNELRANVFFLVPFSQRELLREALEEADKTEQRVEYQLTVLNCKGKEIPVLCWLKKEKDSEEKCVYRAVCIERHPGERALRDGNEKEKSLMEQILFHHELVFEFNREQNWVRCMKDEKKDLPAFMKQTRVIIEDGVNHFVEKLVFHEDRAKTAAYLMQRLGNGPEVPADERPELVFRISTPWNGLYRYSGEYLRLNDISSVFCCRYLDSEPVILPSETVKNAPPLPGVYIRTFGYFDVFADEQPVLFRNEKAKEMLAVLVDRKGGYVSSEEMISYLWPDEMLTQALKVRCRKTAYQLKNTLAEHGIENLLVSVDGKRRVNLSCFRCDLYDYLSGVKEYRSLFHGLYLQNYSWAEPTLGELMEP